MGMMWTPENRPRYNRDKLRYPSDLTNEEWGHVEHLIPPANSQSVKSAEKGGAHIDPSGDVKRSDTAQGFEVLPRRWVVERTFAWLNRCRRLAKDFENRSRNALAFIRLASIRLMLRKLSNSNG
jgi:transposase